MGRTALERGVDVRDEAAATALCCELDITVSHEADGQHTYVNGEDVTGLIRTPEVSMAASTVAKYLGVRQAMVALQQKLAAQTPMLVDGRDICVRVLPNATVKIYLTASAEERARRRWLEMNQKGAPDTYEQVLEDLKKRDAQDMNREVDPLRPTEDAVIVDSTEMNFEQVVENILAIVKEKTA